LQLSLGPPTPEVTIERAEVMWARKETAGLRFVEVSAEARAALEALVGRSAS
jgi:hypothetical protein